MGVSSQGDGGGLRPANESGDHRPHARGLPDCGALPVAVAEAALAVSVQLAILAY